MAFGENIPVGEAEKLREFAEEIAAIQRARAEKSGTPERVAHRKQHVGAVGELVVTAGESERFGVFEEPGKRWPVYARFSNGSGLRLPDSAPDARGFALKLVGVPGTKLIAGLENEVTQDFLFIDTPAIPFRGPDGFMSFLRAAKDGRGKLVPRLIGAFGLVGTFRLLRGALTLPKVRSFATHVFHTAVPVAFGGSAAKLALFPLTADGNATEVRGKDYLRDDLTARLRAGELRWAVRAQRFINGATTPIEDASVAWTGPWYELGTLTLPKQDPLSPRGREIAELVNHLSFDPWHATEAHRPLGGIMRARRVAYAPSVIGRKAASEPREVLSL